MSLLWVSLHQKRPAVVQLDMANLGPYPFAHALGQVLDPVEPARLARLPHHGNVRPAARRLGSQRFRSQVKRRST